MCSVNGASASSGGMLSQEMLRKYITYAKQTCRPRLQTADYDKVARVSLGLGMGSRVWGCGGTGGSKLRGCAYEGRAAGTRRASDGGRYGTCAQALCRGAFAPGC